jgi:hypothetical protein
MDIVLHDYASLRVRQGALIVEHGARDAAAAIRIDVDEPKPQAILFETFSERLTGEALRWCDDRGNRMSPTWARKGSKRWRYYVSQAALQGEKSKAGSIVRPHPPDCVQAWMPAWSLQARICRQSGSGRHRILVSFGFSLLLQPQNMRSKHIKSLFGDIAKERIPMTGQGCSDLRPILRL